MKKILTLLAILIFSHSILFAQIDSTKALKHPTFYEDKTVNNEIGFDMYYFLSIFKAYFAPEPSNIFSISYNRDLTEKISLRTTVGLGYQNVLNKQDTLPSLTTINRSVNLKVGIAWNQKLFGRWQAYYGCDVEYQYWYDVEQQLTKYPNNINNYINNGYMIGAGPFMGLTLFINPRVSLSIEANIHFFYNLSIEKNIDNEHPDLNSHITDNKGFTTVFAVPQNIFLNIKF